MSVTADIKKILTGTTDDKLEVFERQTRSRLSILLEEDTVPDKFEYIIAEVTIKRFNRVSNEGQKSYSQEGLAISFPDSDFDEYLNEINAYLDSKKVVDKAVIRFL